jgi:FdhD protein
MEKRTRGAIGESEARAPAESLTPTRRVEVTRVAGQTVTRTTDVAAAEEPLDVRLHGKSFAVIMRTPGDDKALAAGFLLSERIIRSFDDVGAIEHCKHPDQRKAHHVVDVYLVGGAASRVPSLLDQRRQVIANSSCGVCGRSTIDELLGELKPLNVDPRDPLVPLGVIRALPDRLRARQSTFDETGGLHAAAICSADGEILAAAEDVGRHNAVDKVVGRLLADGSSGRILIVSGRVSFEIVQKAWIAGIPIVAAISAPTSLAIDLAHAAGVTLVGFLRPGSLNIYAGAERLATA